MTRMRWRWILLCIPLAIAAATSSDAAPPADSQPPAAAAAHPSPPAARLPQWVWGPEQRAPGQQVLLERDLELPAGTSGARARLAVEFARCRLIVNGRLQADLDAYAAWQEIDITDAVRAGTNRIQLRLSSVDGPAAVAMALTADTPAGPRTVLTTDDQWTWRTDDPPQTDAARRGTTNTDPAQGGAAKSNAARGKAAKQGRGAADGGDRAPRGDARSIARDTVACFGQVASHLWNASARITAVEDYTQWKRAAGSDPSTGPATFVTLPGFAVDLLHTAGADEGSWVGMAVDDQSRLTIAREDRGLLRLTLSPAGNRVEMVNDTLQEVRGLLYAHGSLYANANGSKALYRLRDTTGDDRFDQVTLLRSWPGGAGHGRNDLTLGPDGWIYSIHGDAVDLPTDDITDFTSPLRHAADAQRSRQGHVVRTDPDGKRWELVCSGLRNPFGIDFNDHGEPFTYDADAEYDMGAPWYRCTRIVHLTLGGDYGWRGLTGQWPPYQLDHADNALPAGDIGKGSPTAVKFGRRSRFPAPYRDALFVLDWAYGRVLACHLLPQGAGYRVCAENFLQGRPLNVTDLDFGPDGEMYLITGGRKTQSALYRIQYVGDKDAAAAGRDGAVAESIDQRRAREAFGRQRRSLRKRLESLITSTDPSAVDVAWPYLDDADPTIRYAARLAVEHQSIDRWADRALAEPDAATAASALLSLARGDADDRAETLLARMNRLPLQALGAYDQLGLLQAYRLALRDPDTLHPATVRQTRDRLRRWFVEASQSRRCGPVGAGDLTNGIGLLAADLQVQRLVPLLMPQLTQARTQEDRLHWLFVLRGAGDGWTLEQRRQYFVALRQLDQTAVAGEGMPGTLGRIREEAVTTLTVEQSDALGDLVQPATDRDVPPLTVARAVVRKWRMEDVAEILGDSRAGGNAADGAELFDQVLCSQCHRMGERGGVVGPDLTRAASRFSRSDLLRSMLAPSDVVAPQYHGVRVLTHSGQVLAGRVFQGGDYRDASLRIVTDPMRPFQYVEVPKSEIQWHEPFDQSPMPAGLLDSLTASEIRDLLAYLESGGNRRSTLP